MKSPSFYLATFATGQGCGREGPGSDGTGLAKAREKGSGLYILPARERCTGRGGGHRGTPEHLGRRGKKGEKNCRGWRGGGLSSPVFTWIGVWGNLSDFEDLSLKKR